ncbi:hypothetical protein [Pedobacter sp. SYP-B3415]|uniref:hypothetical protein n=1 Tax=Pedobacter sp. SYP-B3415 TaxID=2496641 RepID=UPI00101D2060|nr:hypothetical protein [Pedobacter sp. SYP-B3415]
MACIDLMLLFSNKLSGLPIFIILFAIAFGRASAQGPAKTDFAKNQDQKYTLYQVVTDAVRSDSLLRRVVHFLKKEKATAIKQTDSSITCTGVFTVAKRALVSAQPEALVSFSFQLESKSGRYRFWLTDFITTPYKRNRYGQFEPEPGVRLPLEQEPGSLNRKSWEARVKSVEAASRQFAARLRTAVSEVISAPLPKKRLDVKKDEW